MVISFLVGGLSFDKVLLSYQLGYSCCYCDSDVDKVGGGRALQNNSKVIYLFIFGMLPSRVQLWVTRKQARPRGTEGEEKGCADFHLWKLTQRQL